MMLRQKCWTVVVFMILVGTSFPASATEWHEYYQDAEKFAERGNWGTAIEFLKKAIADDPEPSEHKRAYGVRFIEYYPYLKIGEAYLDLKDAEQALQHCQKAHEKGVAPQKLVNNCLKEAAQRLKSLSIVDDERPSSLDGLLPTMLPEEEGYEELPLGKVYAVIIGVGEYHDKRIPALRFTVNDANGLYQILTNPKYGGVPKDHIQLLLDADATDRKIKKAIGGWLSEQTQAEDTVIIYYSGHGASEKDETYWVTYNADIDDLYTTALSNNEIYDMLSRIKSKRMVTFLDSCYSAATVNRKDRTKNIYTKIPLEKFSGTGRVIISASDGKQLSLELEKYEHGVFTYYLLEGLKGGADRNLDGIVDLDETWGYVKDQVTIEAHKAGNSQTPVLQGKLTSGIPLTLNQSALKTGEEKLAEILERGVISQEQYGCALEVLNSGESHPLIEGLLSEGISEEWFGKIFQCPLEE